MNFEFLIMHDYNLFVWPAFIFTFLICFYLFLKTKKEFKKQEILFLKEFKPLRSIKIKTSSGIEIKKENFSGSSI